MQIIFPWLSHQTVNDVVAYLRVMYVYHYTPVNWATYVEWKLDIWNIIFYQFRTIGGPQHVLFHTYPYRLFLELGYQQDTKNAQPGEMTTGKSFSLSMVIVMYVNVAESSLFLVFVSCFHTQIM